MLISTLKRSGKPDLAYVYSKAQGEGLSMPPVMFCGGYASDMNGTKATFLEEVCCARGQAFLRFDYSGHGLSGGLFEDGSMGQWAGDAADILEAVLPQDKVLVVGSSMGGWISMILARTKAERFHAFIGIAAAPDFTEEMHRRLSDAERAEVQQKGFADVQGDGGQIYHFSKHSYDEAKKHLILNQSGVFGFPVHLLQGKLDVSVPWQIAEAIRSHFKNDKSEITYVEDGDHRLSRPEDLALLDDLVVKMSEV